MLTSAHASALLGVFIGLTIALAILLALFTYKLIKKQGARQREQEEFHQDILNLQRQRSLLATAISRHQPHLTCDELEQLPRHVFITIGGKPGLAAAGYETSNACGICLTDYFKGDMVVDLPCKHAFHDLCITQWLNASDKCPFCSAPAKIV